MKIIQVLPEQARHNLRYNMHKVAAVLMRQAGIPMQRDEVTIKEAAFAIGYQFYKNYLEKRAMLDGLMSIAQLRQDAEK